MVKRECEFKEYHKPRYPNDKKLIKYYGCSICEYDLGMLPCDIKYCPICGSKIRADITGCGTKINRTECTTTAVTQQADKEEV